MKRHQTLLESAARTANASATFNSETLGGIIVINATAASATPSVVFTLKGNGPSGGTWDILVSAAITGVGTTVLRIHPGLTAAANTIAKDILPASMTLSAVAADADSLTYSVEFIGVE